MRKMRKLFALMTVAVLLVGMISGCGKAEKDADTAQTQTLNLAIQPAVGFLPLYIMRDEQLLEKALADAAREAGLNF